MTTLETKNKIFKEIQRQYTVQRDSGYYNVAVHDL